MNLKQKLKEVPGKTATPREALAGTYKARVESLTPTVFRSGAFGIKAIYAIAEKGLEKYKVYDNFIFIKKDGKDNDAGYNTFKRLLMAAGLQSEQVLDFNVPENADEFGDLPELTGAKVTLKLETREYEGRKTSEVKAVFART